MSLRIWLPLDGDLRQQGASGANIINNSATVNTTGKIGSCYAFNGSNQYLYSEYNFYSPQYSTCAWVYSTSSSATQTVICNRTTTGSGFSTFLIGGKLRIDPGGQNVQWTTSYTYPTNTWFHLGITYDGAKVSYYINGEYKESYTCTLSSGYWKDLTSFGASYGTQGAYGNYLNGRLNDIRIYDHCLSAAEVHEIAQGLVLHYKLNTLYPASPTHIDSTINDTAYNSSISKYGYNTTSNLAKTSGVFQGKQCIKISTITAGQNAQPYAYFSNLFTSNGTNQPAYKRLEFDYYTTCPTTTWLNIYKLGSGTGTASWTTQSSAGIRSGMYTNSESGHNLLVVPNEWNHVSVVFHGDTDANAEWGYCINGPTHVSNANYYFLYANIVVTASSDLAAEDSSGYSHHGTSFGSLISTAETGRYFSSTKLNSSSPTDNTETGIAYILSPLALTTPNQMTVAWWAKPESGYGGSTNHAAFCTSVNSRPTDYNSTAMHHRDAGFDLCPNSGSVIRLTFNQYTANQWHHYAITYDGQTARAYKDGTALTSTSMASASALKSFTNLWIGYSQAGGVKRKTLGSYSDFRVYVTALSADDILALYHTGAKIDNKQNLHTFELNEINSNIFAGKMWSNSYGSHTPLTSPFINYNLNGEPQFTANGTSAGSEYIKITPGTYEYDYTISVNTGNQFYIGIERYDANKTSRSNAACVYTTAIKPTADIVKQRYKGTVNLTTDGTNTIDTVTLRILNGWSGTTSGVTGLATIHSFSLKLQSSGIDPSLKRTGQFTAGEFKEETNTKFYKDHIVEANEFIEL